MAAVIEISFDANASTKPYLAHCAGTTATGETPAAAMDALAEKLATAEPEPTARTWTRSRTGGSDEQ